MVHALFIAGVATKIPGQKAWALAMLQDMEHAGLSGTVTQVKRLLELVGMSQRNMELVGRSVDEVDWIEV